MTRQTSAQVLRRTLIAAAVASCFAMAAQANPNGPTVAHGSVMFGGLGTANLTITNQAAGNAIINWNGFSIAAGELTRFQQFANLAVLNRVTGGDLSSIFGRLQSDGRVFLINPNGIVFGAGAQIDVAGLVASSLNLTNEDFLAGKMRFQEVLNAGAVSNFGNIFTPAGGGVYLVGPAVTNGGLISSPQGEVVLAAGNSVELMNVGTPGLSVSLTAPANEALNVGQIMADSGRVGIFGGVVSQRGMVNANQAVAGVDGSIKLVATGSATFAAGSQTSATGPLSIDTGDLTVAGNVQSGPQTISATGALTVRGDATGSGQLLASGGQSISAHSVDVSAQNGVSAYIINSGSGDQAINVAGGGASAGLDVRVLTGGGFAIISNDVSGATQSIIVTDADHISANGMGGGAARILAMTGYQSMSITGSGANAIQLGSAGAQGISQLIGVNQSIVAGAPGQAGSISIVGSGVKANPAGIVSLQGSGNTQAVSTSGTLSITGGSAPDQTTGAGLFHNGTGQQTVNAAGIVIQGGPVGSGNGALINSNGWQQVNAGAGGIAITGGAGVASNPAGIFQTRADPTLTQTIAVRDGGSLTLRGGGAGTSNTAVVSAVGGMQRIDVGGGGKLEMFGGSAGVNNYAVLASRGGLQSIETGNLSITAGAAGAGNFASISGLPQAISVHGDLTINGGGSDRTAVFGGGAGIGGFGGATPSATYLTLSIDGNLMLNGGTVANSSATIGGSIDGGQRTDLNMTVHGDVTLNPGAVAGAEPRIGSPSVNVAGGDIVLNVDGKLALNSAGPGTGASIRTGDGVKLRAREIVEGPDAVIQASRLDVATEKGASLIGANAVNTFSANNSALGAVELSNSSTTLVVTGVQNASGALALRQTGDLLVNGNVSTGPQSVDVTGGLSVQPGPGPVPGPAGQLNAHGGQAISARFVDVSSRGGLASITNLGGEQRISTSGASPSGEGLAVRGAGGGGALIQNSGGPQVIEVSNADRVVIDAGQGLAQIVAMDGGQAISATGSGANALVLGSPSALNQSAIVGGGSTQTVLAGNPGEQGSITIYGNANGGPGNNFIVSALVEGGTQTVSTSGTLSVFGGTAPSGSNAGIFANGIEGLQSVSAGSILLQAGSTGGGNSAHIAANRGAQTVSAGSITLIGGAAGTNNAAQLRASGGQQTIAAGQLTVGAGAGGTNNFAAITAPSQNIAVTGDVTISGGGSVGTPDVGGGARIGGRSGVTVTPTEVTLTVGGNVTLNGGTVAGAGAAIGSSQDGGLTTQVTMNVGGNVTLNTGAVPNAGTRVGSPGLNVAGGEIVINAGGAIALNSAGPGNAGAIRTLDGVTLRAREIMEGTDASIQANAISIETQHGASLVGANAINSLSAVNMTSGAMAFNNTSLLLSVTGIDQVPSGALSLNQAGNLLISGNVSSGAQSITASGDMTVAAGTGHGVTVKANGSQSFNVGGSFSLLGGSAFDGYVQTIAKGPLEVRTGGNLMVQGGSGFFAYGLLYAADEVRLTVGNEVHLNGGTWPLAFARIQSGFCDKIYLDFPNRTSGGYFVDGREGVTHKGLDGYYTGVLPAKLGRSLIVEYGE